MSETKFTKGKWIVDFNGDVGVEVGSETIASMSDMECSYIKEDNVHNAFLIAAAPEMYKALQSILDSPYTELQEEDFEMIEKTLAKARGEK